MYELRDLKEKFNEELGKIARKSDLSAGDVETVFKLTNIIKNIDKICMSEDNGYSGDRNYSYTGTKRYSRDGSRENMLSKLEEMIHNADSDRMKMAIRKCINEIERD